MPNSVLFFQRTHVKDAYVNLIDLVKSLPTSIYQSVAKVGFGTAENEPLKVCQELNS